MYERISSSISRGISSRLKLSFLGGVGEVGKNMTVYEYQDDIVVVEIKDYIANPKPNGYRSLHLILEVPIFLSDCKKHVRAEVQFRTIAMDFWASLEHKLKYKQDIAHADRIADELRKCADTICQVDNRMQGIRKMIDRKQWEPLEEDSASGKWKQNKEDAGF